MQHDLNYLRTLVKETGDILLQHFGTGQILSSKSHRDILHEADLAANTYLTEKLTEKFPDTPILSEEDAESHEMEKVPYRFIIDPLDGTINFSRGFEDFGVFLALQENNKTIFGLAYKPVHDVLYEGEKGRGSFVNGKKLQVSTMPTVSESIIAIDPPRSENTFPFYINAIRNNARGYRSYGCAIQTLGYIAEGKLDAYLYNTPKIWDIAAMAIILEEAGGLLLNFDGTPWEEKKSLLVCTPSIKEELLSYIAQPHS